jgi:glycerophosphoryl diester phosphodiesterase
MSPDRNHALPWIIAHRGASQEAPENTCSAFERALTYSISGIEFDVQLTADKVPVVCHDPTLRRITGSRRRISNCTYDELAAVDWGGWFHTRFSGETLPTLDEVLTNFGPRTRLLVEIKADAQELKSGRTRELAARVAAMLSAPEYGLIDEQLCVLCFYPKVLEIMYRQAPQLPYVLNVMPKHIKELLVVPEAVSSRWWAVDVDIKGLSETVVTWARQRGLRIFTYTCNTASQIEKASTLGVDGIISDRPGWLAHRLLAHG